VKATPQEPLLLINGYAATGADWDPTFLAELGRSHRVICPDNRGLGGSNRGLGGSELGAEELTIDLMASDLEALLDERGIERLPVVGWSMGGFVAQRLAERAPRRVAALVLIATDPGGPAAVAAAPQIWSQLVDHTGTPREQATRLLGLLFPPPLAAEIDRQFGEVVAAARAQLSVDVLSAQELAMEAWHREVRASIGAGEGPPTLVLHGEEDIVIPAANAELLAERWSAAGGERFAGCGHAVMAQEPRRVAGAIREFL
jgi:3-oxoadipate enol-lactonase